MKKKIVYIMFFMLSIFTGCKNNLSLTMNTKNKKRAHDYTKQITDELNYQVFDNNYFELEWGIAFPINYFLYDYKSTTLFLQQYGEINSEISILDVTVAIEPWHYSHVFVLENDMKIKNYKNTYIIDLIDCMSDILKEEQDLLKFKNLDLLKVYVRVRKGEIEKVLSFDFIPKIEKSNKLLNNLMSI